MSNKNSISNTVILKYIFRSFCVSRSEVKQIIRDFHSEMGKGLRGRKSSLKMIPTYVDRPSGQEKGRFIALDLGGTNLRILELELKGNGRIIIPAEKRFILNNKLTKGPGFKFFDFLAGCVKNFTKEINLGPKEGLNLGFTFSFPIKQTGVASGVLLRWTKDFSVKGVRNKEVVGLLRGSLARQGADNIKIAALVNDTVGTLVARSYFDPACDIGVILGTGTNACYREKNSLIAGLKQHAGFTIVNIEWGNFNKLKVTPYDRELDNGSANPQEQILEKMVSGMYLGEIARLIMRDLAERKILFLGAGSTVLNAQGSFKAEHMSGIEADFSRGLSGTGVLLKRLGIQESTPEDRALVREICKAVSTRGARISAAVLAAVVTKIDNRLSGKHTVAIDGSLYEKHPGYAQNIKSALKEIFGARSRNIRLILTKDGSGKGAGITAAAAVSQKEADA